MNLGAQVISVIGGDIYSHHVNIVAGDRSRHCCQTSYKLNFNPLIKSVTLMHDDPNPAMG